jgi:prefoldin alpha subunit
MEDQQRLQALVDELNMYQQQAELLQQQMEAMQVTLGELESLENTVTALKEGENLETLVPVGAGSFINAEIKNTNEIIMSVGAGVAITKNIDDAQKTITSQKEEIKEAMGKMSKNIQTLNDMINKITPQAEQLLQQVQGSGQ